VTLSIVDFLSLLREDSGARFLLLMIVLFTVFALAILRTERRR
jgi:hypothetical protein